MLARLVSYVRRHHLGALALFVALSGTAYAATLPRNSVGTPQLKKNAVTGAKVKGGTLQRSDFKSSSLPKGPRGEQGPRGLQGLAGPPGPPGAAGATRVTVRLGADVVGTSVASCVGNERAVGGGGIATGTDGVLWASNPTPASGTPTGWEANAVVREGVYTDDSAQAYVICAAP